MSILETKELDEPIDGLRTENSMLKAQRDELLYAAKLARANIDRRELSNTWRRLDAAIATAEGKV